MSNEVVVARKSLVARIRKPFIILCVFGLVVTVVALAAVNLPSFRQVRSITVVGSAVETVNVDHLLIHANIVVSSTSQNDLRANGESKYSSVRDSIVKNANLKIEQQQYQIVERKGINNNVQGYSYSRELIISAPVDTASNVLGILNTNGVSDVWIQLLPADKNYDQELRAKAISDAKSKAEDIAATQNVSLGKLLSASELPQTSLSEYSTRVKPGAIEVDIPDKTEITHTITATFEIY